MPSIDFNTSTASPGTLLAAACWVGWWYTWHGDDMRCGLHANHFMYVLMLPPRWGMFWAVCVTWYMFFKSIPWTLCACWLALIGSKDIWNSARNVHNTLSVCMYVRTCLYEQVLHYESRLFLELLPSKAQHTSFALPKQSEHGFTYQLLTVSLVTQRTDASVSFPHSGLTPACQGFWYSGYTPLHQQQHLQC